MVEEKIEAELAQGHLASQIGIILMNHGCPHIRQKDLLQELMKVRLYMS